MSQNFRLFRTSNLFKTSVFLLMEPGSVSPRNAAGRVITARVVTGRVITGRVPTVERC